MPNRSIMTLRPGSQNILKKRPGSQKKKEYGLLGRHVGATDLFVCLRTESILARVRNSCYLFIPNLPPLPHLWNLDSYSSSPNSPPVLPVLKRTIMSPVNADLRAGDPEVRPAFGRCVLSLNSGMAALDDQFAGKVLMVTINGDRPPVSPDDLVKALGIAHNIQISDLLVEVCPPPADFFVRFRTTFDCSRVTSQIFNLVCNT